MPKQGNCGIALAWTHDSEEIFDSIDIYETKYKSESFKRNPCSNKEDELMRLAETERVALLQQYGVNVTEKYDEETNQIRQMRLDASPFPFRRLAFCLSCRLVDGCIHVGS